MRCMVLCTHIMYVHMLPYHPMTSGTSPTGSHRVEYEWHGEEERYPGPDFMDSQSNCYVKVQTR